MKNPHILITLRTKANTTDFSLGEKFVDSLCQEELKLRPEKISHNPDKFSKPFVASESCREFWASKALIEYDGKSAEFRQDFAWKRKSATKSAGTVSHTLVNDRGNLVPGAIIFRSDLSRAIDWYSLLKTWSSIFPPQLGMLHLFTAVERSSESGRFDSGTFGARWNAHILNMGWAMIYGNEFASEVNFDRIDKAGFPIEKLGESYLVRVTEKIHDVIDDFPYFSRRRAELKGLFRDGLFEMKDEPLMP